MRACDRAARPRAYMRAANEPEPRGGPRRRLPRASANPMLTLRGLLLLLLLLLLQLPAAHSASEDASVADAKKKKQQQKEEELVPTCSDHVVGLGLSCNSSCVCPTKTGCVPVPTFAPEAAKCMPTYDHVKVVHVINSCHLDIGFVNSSVAIVNLYFDKHIPLAIAVGKELRAGGSAVANFSDNKLNFMFQSWIVDMYLDCPPGLGYHCPNASQVVDARAAIAAGDITWQAYPHNAQLEVTDPALIKAGLAHTFALDANTSQPRKRTLSQRDVPGLTRGAIPILTSMGIRAISIGQNSGSPIPQTNNYTRGCFVWRDPESRTELYYLDVDGYGWWAGGHGCEFDLNGDPLGMEHGLVLNFNGDNEGPSTAAQYSDTWRDIQITYPNAVVVASTFDNFTQHLDSVKKKLPVVTSEVGDTWAYGIPSDPQKVSRIRVIGRAYAALDNATAGGIVAALADDPVLRNATRFALKLTEHTWGKDVKTYLFDDSSWKNREFEAARSSSNVSLSSQYAALEQSWWEQRHWGVTVFMQTLLAARHPFAESVSRGFDELKPTQPTVTGYTMGKAGQVFTCGNTEIAFDSTGSISHMARDGTTYADASHTLMQLKYRSYSADDVASFLANYCHSNATWIQHDYGKPGLPADVLGKIWTPTLQNLYVKPDHHGISASNNRSCSFVLQSAFDPVALSEYGAADAWTTVNVNNESGEVTVEINMFNKSSTRIPEAMFVQMVPTIASGHWNWSVNKLGARINAADVVNGGAKHLHGITRQPALSMATSGAERMSVSALDVAVLNFGELTAYPSPVWTEPDTDLYGASFLLWDNLWGTNYVMWWPFVVPPPAMYASSSTYFPTSSNNDMVSRFKINFEYDSR